MYVFFGPFFPSRLTRFLEICISCFCAVLRQLLLWPEIFLFVLGPPSNSNFLLCVAILPGKKIAEKGDDAIKSRINSFIYYGYIFLLGHLKNSFSSFGFISISRANGLFAWLEMRSYYRSAFYLFMQKTRGNAKIEIYNIS